jgi:hypothetical protein
MNYTEETSVPDKFVISIILCNCPIFDIFNLIVLINLIVYKLNVLCILVGHKGLNIKI